MFGRATIRLGIGPHSSFNKFSFIFSERELMLSPVPPSVVCLSSVTFVRPTQPVEIFGNVSMH